MGITSQSTIAAKANRDEIRRLLEDPEYLAARRARIIMGDAPQLETLLYHYAYGKPTEVIDLRRDHDDLANMNDAEMLATLQTLKDKLLEGMNDAVPSPDTTH